MNKWNHKSWIDGCEKLVMALLCILMVDCTVFGAGRIVEVGPLGFRMILVGLVMAAGVPVFLRDFKKLIRTKLMWVFAGFGAWLVLQAVRGVLGGNDPGILASDLKGFCYFVVVLPAVCVLNSKERVHTLMKAMLYASGLLAILSLVSTCVYKWDNELFELMYAWDPKELVLDLSVIIPNKVPRLFFKSTNYFLAGCAFSIYFYVTEKGRCQWQYPVMTGLFLFALLMSYTRAVYLAAFIAAAVLVLVFQSCGTREYRVRLWKHLVAATLVFGVITGGLSVIMDTNYIEHGLRRVVATFGAPAEAETASVPRKQEPVNTQGPQVVMLSNVTMTTTAPEQEWNNAEAMTRDSDKIREMTLAEMRIYIQEAPLMGHGLGKPITCRWGGLTEYFYHDVVVKSGVIGLLLYLLPVLWMLVGLLKKDLSKSNKLILGSWLAVLLGFMGFSYYNPYMNASLGILFYCCTVGIFVNLKHKRNF